MTSHECPTCGRDDFTHERDMKAHPTIAHGERLLDYQNPGECPTCGEIFASAAGMKAHHTISHSESIAESRRVSRSIRQQVIERDDRRCQRCDVAVTPNDQAGPDFQLHHIIPFAAGAPDHPDNLVTLCSDCHVAAHNQMRNILDERPNWSTNFDPSWSANPSISLGGGGTDLGIDRAVSGEHIGPV